MSTKRKIKLAKRSDTAHPSVIQWTGILLPSTAGLFIVLSVILVTGLSIVNTTHENRFIFNKLQEMKEQANQFEVEWGQLLIEQSTFGIEGRIEQKAIEQLKMQVPELSNIVMVRHEQ